MSRRWAAFGRHLPALVFLAAASSHTPVIADGSIAGRFQSTECLFDTSGMDLERIRCGYMSVPENRAEDDGRVLRIAFAIVEAPEATDDPVVLLPGGPGVAPVFDGYVGLIHRWIPTPTTAPASRRMCGISGGGLGTSGGTCSASPTVHRWRVR
jgi:hypothetical protein